MSKLGELAGPAVCDVAGPEQLTAEVSGRVAQLHTRLLRRAAAPPEVLRLFTLQMVWCLFADSLGLTPRGQLRRVLRQLRDGPNSPSMTLGSLYGTAVEGSVTDGGLPGQLAPVMLEPGEVQTLFDVSSYDWRQVDPTIFGVLTEGSFGGGQRSARGVHYTSVDDIMQVIGPTIVQPWEERIGMAGTAGQAETVAHELAAFQVLDPACGCGNFLYVTLREVCALTRRLHAKVRALREHAGVRQGPPLPMFGLSNLHGFEIDPFVARVARATPWMGYRLIVGRYGTDASSETSLPVTDLGTVQVADAVFAAWPDVDVVVGNPPFIGTKSVRSRLGSAYADALRDRFGVGVTDYAVYWFRRTHDHLRPGQRAGLVATNSIRESRNRKAALDYIRDNGGVITSAVSSQRWSGDANVYVSIVNWVKPSGPVSSFTLNGRPAVGITTTLEEGDLRPPAAKLAGNAGGQHAGVVPNPVRGFCVDQATAAQLRARTDVDYSTVVQPYLTGEDLLQTPGQEPTRWIINFRSWPLETAMGYPAALELVRARVKPVRDASANPDLRARWWQFARTLDAMWAAIDGLDRYIVAPATGKRIQMSWAQPGWCPSNATSIFPFSDDYAMGVLSSRWHLAWASQTEVSSTLRVGQRYVGPSFHTFPWPPDPSGAAVGTVRDAARHLIGIRDHLCRQQHIGLTTLYNQVDDGAYQQLVDAQGTLDEAVAGAYGWPVCSWPAFRDRLYLLNRQITADPDGYVPFGSARQAPSQRCSERTDRS